MENYLDYTFVVSSADIDIWGALKPAAILAICQDMAYRQSASMGGGYDALAAHNMTWVLSRAKVCIDRVPRWHESLTVRTWHKGQSGIFSLRDYIFYDSSQEPIIRVTSSWLIINVESRRIARVDKIFNQTDLSSLPEYQYDAIPDPAERIDSLQGGEKLGEHMVRYSDMDVNRHVNNTRYMEWACDYSQMQMQCGEALKGFTINFNHEAKYQDVVVISSSAQPSSRVVIEGADSQRNIFAVVLEYGEC